MQNESSGKSSWWTVDLEAKSGRTSRRNRSQSVDNGNTPSPKTPRKKKGKIKQVKGGTSPNDLSPCDSPTTSSPHLQAPWSPNPPCPSPAPSGSDLSPCYSPVLQSPVLQRSSRNVTPVSPLVSPPALDSQGATGFSGSNSSLILDDVQLHENSLDSPVCLDMFAQLNLSTRRDGMGSSSSLSSLHSPRFAPVAKSPHPIFTFNNPPVDSSGYSSSTCFSDTDNPESAGATVHTVANSLPNTHPSVSAALAVHPPSYEEHVTQHAPAVPSPHITPPHRPTCFTPTRSGRHPLQISLAAPPDPNRPRSGSEPAPVNLSHRYPQDIDMDLFDNSGFPNCDVDSIIRTEMQYSNGELDFQFDQQYSTPSNYNSQASDPTLTSATLGPDHLRMQQYRAGTSAW